MYGPTSLDLITVEQAVEWIFGTQQKPNQNLGVLQTLISSLSLDFLRRTGRAAQDGSIPAESPFNQAVSYQESYTGNGNAQIQIRNWPAISGSSVTVFGQTVPQSTGPNAQGWFITSDGKFLALRGGGAQRSGYGGNWSGLRGGLGNGSGWPKAVDCIQFSYLAGFAAKANVNELQRIPVLPAAWAANHSYGVGSQIFDGTNVQVATAIAGNATTGVSGPGTPIWSGAVGAVTADGAYLAWINIGPPYSVTVNQQPWLADAGVLFFIGGTPLTKVNVSPSGGQYYLLGNGTYLFNSTDAGKQIQVSYSSAGTPLDIQEAMLRWVNLIYKRRGWEGISSLAQKDAGSTTYTQFEVDKSIRETIRFYTRRA